MNVLGFLKVASHFQAWSYQSESFCDSLNDSLVNSRQLTRRIELSNQERRRLVKHGKKLGARIKELISIVSYSTFRKWVRSVECLGSAGSGIFGPAD